MSSLSSRSTKSSCFVPQLGQNFIVLFAGPSFSPQLKQNEGAIIIVLVASSAETVDQRAVGPPESTRLEGGAYIGRTRCGVVSEFLADCPWPKIHCPKGVEGLQRNWRRKREKTRGKKANIHSKPKKGA